MNSYLSINKEEFEKLSKADQIVIAMRSPHILTKAEALKQIKGYKNSDKAEKPKKQTKKQKDGV